jgi:hypothetical protein
MRQIYKSYFQKSKVFLYPLLGIKKGIRFVPIETYISWKNYNSHDIKNYLICVFYVDETERKEFNLFSERELESNEFFESKAHTNYLNIIVFNLEYFKKDIEKFKQGKYSRFSPLTKKIILDFFGDIGSISNYMESYLYPEKYYDIYSEILNVPIDVLIEVEELCDKPNLEKESFQTELVELALFK